MIDPAITAAPGLKLIPRARSLVDTEGTFAGYASLFDREDATHDVVMPGAFRASLVQRGAAGIRMLFQHDASQPIGVWEEVTEDARGLYCRGRLALGVARAREVLSLMRDRAIDGLSIGFKAVRFRRDARSGLRRLDRIDLWEISVVTFPMLPGARVDYVKAADRRAGVPAERELGRRRARRLLLSN